jgi:putative thioredoxin
MSHDLVNFQADVLERSRQIPVLVDFWAEWCGPCKMLGPVVEKLAGEAGGRWALVKVNTEVHPELAAQFQIRGIPNLKLFHQGAVIAELGGALPEPQLRAWLAENLPTPKREAMARARELLLAGRSASAADLLRPLAATHPGDAELAVLTARAVVFWDPPAAAALVAAIPPASPWAEGAALVLDLAAAFNSVDDARQLPAGPLRDRYVSAVGQLRHEEFDAGLAALIELLLEKPGYDQGRAKALGRAIFRHLGPRHPVAEQHSRTFSMAVNA